MKDIISVGDDIGLFDSQVPKATNVLSVQLAELEYAQSLGIDLKYFLSEEFRFQNSSFKAYLIEVLANNSINVASVIEDVEVLFTRFIFNIAAPEETNSGLITR